MASLRVNAVTDFGASPGSDCTTALQNAIDSFASITTNSANSKKGVVYLPSDTGAYKLSKPLWLDVPNVELVGDGDGTIIQVTGGPRCNAIQVGIRRSEAGNTNIGNSSYRVDAYGTLDTSAASATGQRWSYRTNGDSWAQFQAGPLDCGPMSATGTSYCDQWGETNKLCIEFFISQPSAANKGLFGVGAVENLASYQPWPWFVLSGATTSQLMFVFRTSNDDAFGSTSHRFSFPVASWPARVCIQVDLTTGTYQAYVNKTQVATTNATNMTGFGGASVKFLPNQYHPFMLGSHGVRGPLQLAGTGLDVTYHGLRVSKALRYNDLGAGQAQTRTSDSSTTFNDLQQYFSNDSNVVAWLPLQDNPSTAGRNFTCRAGQAGFDVNTTGIMMSTAFAGGLIGNSVKSMQVQAANCYGQAISLGAVLHTKVDAVTAWQGYHGIGTWNAMASYKVKVSDCSLHGYGSPFYSFMQLGKLSDIECQNSGRVTFRLAASNIDLSDFFVTFPDPISESCISIQAATDYGGAYKIENGLIDFEGDTYSRCGLYAERHPYVQPTCLRVTDVHFGTIGSSNPIIRLSDVSTTNGTYKPAYFHADGVTGSNYGSYVELSGGGWYGEAILPVGLTGTRVTHSQRWGTDANVQVVETLDEIPTDGAWYSNAHRIMRTAPASNEFAEIRCLTSGDFASDTHPIFTGVSKILAAAGDGVEDIDDSDGDDGGGDSGGGCGGMSQSSGPGSITRQAVEKSVVSRTKGLLAFVDKNTSRAGVNPDLEDPIAEAAASLGIAAASPGTITDSDLSGLSNDQFFTLCDLSTYYTIMSCLNSFVETDESSQDRRQAWNAMAKRFLEQADRLKDQYSGLIITRQNPTLVSPMPQTWPTPYETTWAIGQGRYDH